GVVYVGSDDGNVYALHPQNGTLLWQASTGGGVDLGPAVANGVLYVASKDNNLYSFDLAASTFAKFRPPVRPEPKSLRPDYTLKPLVMGGKAAH
ncbi:MAG TPA: PQQ-binding-like beta-propeller repeat protein, partial [Terriglobales bacterium]|nr:PQQ-binding-like beta-propeller repeat protein [Terriglobales bacterium]